MDFGDTHIQAKPNMYLMSLSYLGGHTHSDHTKRVLKVSIVLVTLFITVFYSRKESLFICISWSLVEQLTEKKSIYRV